jgi:hypothetical protein
MIFTYNFLSICKDHQFHILYIMDNVGFITDSLEFRRKAMHNKWMEVIDWQRFSM